LGELAKFLNAGKHVTLLCGRGCAGTHGSLMQLADTLKSPIVHAFRGKEHVEYDNPFDVGMTGLIGFSSGYHAMLNCDTLLMLGTDFPYRQFYPTDSRIAQVDLRPENLGRRTRLDLGVIGDVSATISGLLPQLTVKTDRSHLDQCLAGYRRAREGLDDLATGRPGSKLIHPQYLTKLINDHAAQDAIFTFDVGTPAIWVARYLKMNGRRRLIGSMVHGSMANALPQAIGAQAAFPGRQVISLSGDGGFAMLMGDFLTLVQQKLPLKIVIFNNGTLGFVALEMKASGFLETGTLLNNPDTRRPDEPARVGNAAGDQSGAGHGLQSLGTARSDQWTRRRSHRSRKIKPVAVRRPNSVSDSVRKAASRFGVRLGLLHYQGTQRSIGVPTDFRVGTP